MARKKKHEEHVNAEAWAIPYGDLVTLLLALFVVMYAMSSVNEGKYRILSDSMVAAFRGTPKNITPISIGTPKSGRTGNAKLEGVKSTTLIKVPDSQLKQLELAKPVIAPDSLKVMEPQGGVNPGASGASAGALVRMERDIQAAMQALIEAKLVKVKREPLWLEVEINTDILFPSGSAMFTGKAGPVLEKLASVLKPFSNPVRVEGHTDDRPIKTAQFPSNWELSAARAASVVHQFTREGIDPLRLEIVGFGEYRPLKPNSAADGRNANRRVSILILEATGSPDAMIARSSPGAAGAAADRNVALADARSADNRLVYRMSPESLEKTVLNERTGDQKVTAPHGRAASPAVSANQSASAPGSASTAAPTAPRSAATPSVSGPAAATREKQ